MAQGNEIERHMAAILNDWWMVRHYSPQRTPAMRLKRAQAIKKLGMTIRRAFNATDNFEPLIGAVLDGGRPRDERPF